MRFNFDRVLPWGTGVVVVAIIAIGAVGAHREFTNPIVQTGDVVGTRYVPASTHMQPIPNANGGFTYIPQHTPERYILVREAWRKDGTRTTFGVRTDAATYSAWQHRLGN